MSMNRLKPLVELLLNPDTLAKKLGDQHKRCMRRYHILADDELRPASIYERINELGYYMLHPMHLARILNALTESPKSGEELFTATKESRYKRAVAELRILGAAIIVKRCSDGVRRYHLEAYPEGLEMHPATAYARKQEMTKKSS